MDDPMLMAIIIPSRGFVRSISAKTTDFVAGHILRLSAEDIESRNHRCIRFIWKVSPILIRSSRVDNRHEVYFSTDRLDSRGPPQIESDEFKWSYILLSRSIERSPSLPAEYAVLAFPSKI